MHLYFKPKDLNVFYDKACISRDMMIANYLQVNIQTSNKTQALQPII